MRSRDDIQDAHRRIDEATELYHFRLRATVEEFDALESNWADSCARRFKGLHLEPQATMMKTGGLLCGETAKSVEMAGENVAQAEEALRQAYAFEAEFDSESQNTARLLRAAEELGGHAESEINRVARESASLRGAIAAAAHDPGW